MTYDLNTVGKEVDDHETRIKAIETKLGITPPSPTPITTIPGDLPGWRRVFVDDFLTNCAEGQFLTAYGSRWGAYPNTWKDTSKNGTYSPEIISVHDSCLDIHLQTVNGVIKVAAPVAKIPGAIASKWGDLLYGRYAVRFRADQVPGFKTAWLLWPQDGIWPQHGEIDFPEGNLNSTISAFMHRMNATVGNDQDAYPTGQNYLPWHTAVIEWGLNRCAFILDDKVIGVSTSRVPSTPMHWVIQTETQLSGGAPAATAQGHVLIDWAAVWVPA